MHTCPFYCLFSFDQASGSLQFKSSSLTVLKLDIDHIPLAKVFVDGLHPSFLVPTFLWPSISRFVHFFYPRGPPLDIVELTQLLYISTPPSSQGARGITRDVRIINSLWNLLIWMILLVANLLHLLCRRKCDDFCTVF